MEFHRSEANGFNDLQANGPAVFTKFLCEEPTISTEDWFASE